MPSLDQVRSFVTHVPGKGLAAASFVTHHWLLFGIATAYELLRPPVTSILNESAANFNRIRDAKTDGKVERIRMSNEQEAKALRSQTNRPRPVRRRRRQRKSASSHETKRAPN